MDTTNEGLQRMVATHSKECGQSFYEKSEEIPAAAWSEQGWNVGVLYWDQFADEVCICTLHLNDLCAH